MRIWFGVALVVLAGLLMGCGGDDSGDDEPAAEENVCEEAEAPEPRTVELDPPPEEPSAMRLTAVVTTNCGVFEIALDTKGSPKTAASFEYLAKNGAFDQTPIHRIGSAFIQGGDPEGTGFGGPGYTIAETPPPDAAYTRGVVAMAKTEVEPPGTSGSQFFVITAADAGLPPQFAIAGRVTSGLDVVRKIASLRDPSGSEAPLEPVVIDSVTIEAG